MTKVNRTLSKDDVLPIRVAVTVGPMEGLIGVAFHFTNRGVVACVRLDDPYFYEADFGIEGFLLPTQESYRKAFGNAPSVGHIAWVPTRLLDNLGPVLPPDASKMYPSRRRRPGTTNEALRPHLRPGDLVVVRSLGERDHWSSTVYMDGERATLIADNGNRSANQRYEVEFDEETANRMRQEGAMLHWGSQRHGGTRSRFFLPIENLEIAAPVYKGRRHRPLKESLQEPRKFKIGDRVIIVGTGGHPSTLLKKYGTIAGFYLGQRGRVLVDFERVLDHTHNGNDDITDENGESIPNLHLHTGRFFEEEDLKLVPVVPVYKARRHRPLTESIEKKFRVGDRVIVTQKVDSESSTNRILIGATGTVTSVTGETWSCFETAVRFDDCRGLSLCGDNEDQWSFEDDALSLAPPVYKGRRHRNPPINESMEWVPKFRVGDQVVVRSLGDQDVWATTRHLDGCVGTVVKVDPSSMARLTGMSCTVEFEKEIVNRLWKKEVSLNGNKWAFPEDNLVSANPIYKGRRHRGFTPPGS